MGIEKTEEVPFYDKEIELLIHVPEIKENHTVYWYWKAISYNLEVDLNDHLCLTLPENEKHDWEAAMFMILFWISWKWEFTNLWYKVANDKIYIYQRREKW